MHKYKKVGLSLIFLAILMFLFGLDQFVSNHPSANYFVKKLGEFSFVMWAPVLVIGLFYFIRSKK